MRRRTATSCREWSRRAVYERNDTLLHRGEHGNEGARWGFRFGISASETALAHPSSAKKFVKKCVGGSGFKPSLRA